MKVAIAGTGGLVGREFTRQLSGAHQVLSLKHCDLDVADVGAVGRLFAEECPELVINCAVLGVDACELDPSSAWSVNARGAENLARAADAVGAEFLQLSTNYVFDGRREHGPFYTQEDAPAPVNVYGLTKLAGERAAYAAARRCYVVRTSWAFGLGKEELFGRVPRALRAGEKIKAITDVWASATYVRDLVSRAVEILARRHYSTFHVVNGGLCSYHDFASEAGRALRMSDEDLRALIEPVKVSEFRHRAERPRYTPLRCLVSERIGLDALRDWRASLAEYIREGGAS